MTVFLIAAGAMALIAVIFVVRPLLSGDAHEESRDAADARVFRDQLDELDRDLARGVISEREAEGAKAEVSRRLLRAAERGEVSEGSGPAPRTATGLVAGIALLGAPVVGAIVYLGVGEPGLPDQPLAERHAAIEAAERRLTQGEAEARVAEAMAETPAAVQPQFPQEYLDLIGRLETIVAERPDDPEGHRLLANAYMQMERYAEAWPLMARLIELEGASATAEQFAVQLEAMVLASGGYVSTEAETVMAESLNRDPAQPIARYYDGLVTAQKGNIDGAIAKWSSLLASAPPGADWVPFVENMLAEATRVRGEAMAGLPPAPPGNQAGGQPGPSDADIVAAQNMTPEERQAMIEGMVSRLEERLTTEGGTPQEWLQLVNSKLRLGRADEAAEAYELALRNIPDGADKDEFQRVVRQIGLGDRPAAPGPSAEDMAAAAEMSPEDRQAMIEGMVGRLQDRLSTEGGEPEEFVRLMNAYRVLGRQEDARAAYDLSQEKLGGSAASFVREQALVTGVISE